ncbi:GroES-like protein [Cadophora sp. DSE1049]|nr:GroES-like protein [Cadophora sp. DSE1049]
MAATTSTMRAWQYSSSNGPLSQTIHLNPSTPQPPFSPNQPQMLIAVTSMSLNPADYKIAEMGLINTLMISKPATPGMDFSGRVVTLGSPTDVFKVGDKVFGRLEPGRFGSLEEFVVAAYDACAVIPDGLDEDLAAGVSTAGLTAYQTIVPNVKEGDKVFINGGSGSVGTFGIQIAKAIGCHVTVSCSTGKIESCKQDGADEVIDYTSTDVTQRLVDDGLIYSLVVDNVGTSPSDLYTRADKFLLPAGKFVQVGGTASLETARVYLSRLFLPSILGGGSRKFEAFFTKNSREVLERIARWVVDGKVKVPVEQVFEYEDVPRAIELLKKGGGKGKIIVHVGK